MGPAFATRRDCHQQQEVSMDRSQHCTSEKHQASGPGGGGHPRLDVKPPSQYE